MMGPAELAETLTGWCDALNNLFLGPGHALHVVYERDPGEGREVAREAMARSVGAGRARGLDLEDLFAEREERLRVSRARVVRARVVDAGVVPDAGAGKA